MAQTRATYNGRDRNEQVQNTKHFRSRVERFACYTDWYRYLSKLTVVALVQVLSKMAYTQRVRRVLKSKKAQTVASNIALRLKKACRKVVVGGGSAIRG